MVHELEQVGSIEFLLLTPRLFKLIRAALARTQSFEDFAFAVSLLVGLGGLLTERFEAANFVLELEAELAELVAEEAGELEFGGGTSGGEAGRVGEGRVGEIAFELRECFARPGELQRGFLQSEGALALNALAESKQGRKRETESHKFRRRAP